MPRRRSDPEPLQKTSDDGVLLLRRQDLRKGRAGLAGLLQQGVGFTDRDGVDESDGTIALPRAQAVGFVAGFVVHPPDLEHQVLTVRGSGGRHPGGVTARLERRSNPQRPPLGQVLDDQWQGRHPRAAARADRVVLPHRPFQSSRQQKVRHPVGLRSALGHSSLGDRAADSQPVAVRVGEDEFTSAVVEVLHEAKTFDGQRVELLPEAAGILGVDVTGGRAGFWLPANWSSTGPTVMIR
jgi:hypothetical protein